MPRNSMPEGWEPPAPAWQSLWQNTQDDLVAGYFGIQAEEPDLLQAWADRAFVSDHAPASLEQGKYVDQNGVTNYLYIGYWRLPDYEKWWSRGANSDWWSDTARESEKVGYWREIIRMPFERFETLYSNENAHGINELADGFEGPILEHGYAGGARDRIALSETDSLKNIESVSVRLASGPSVNGSHSRVKITPPEYMCVIRSGQDWSFCEGDEETYYLEQLHPVLIEGMNFLRDNPDETNCYSMRFVDKVNSSWGGEQQTFGLGYATDIYAFEDWAKSHPTHLAILGGFMQMVEKFGPEMKLQLWHEVTVLPATGCEFEYISCSPQTGLLSYS